MAQWFYLVNGQQHGPIDPADLKRLAAAGQLQPTDKVRREDMAQWFQAKQVKGLFAAVSSAAASAPSSTKEKSARAGSATAPRSSSDMSIDDVYGRLGRNRLDAQRTPQAPPSPPAELPHYRGPESGPESPPEYRGFFRYIWFAMVVALLAAHYALGLSSDIATAAFWAGTLALAVAGYLRYSNSERGKYDARRAAARREVRKAAWEEAKAAARAKASRPARKRWRELSETEKDEAATQAGKVMKWAAIGLGVTTASAMLAYWQNERERTERRKRVADQTDAMEEALRRRGM